MCKLEKDQIPKNVDFFEYKASAFDPDENIVKLENHNISENDTFLYFGGVITLIMLCRPLFKYILVTTIQ